jgi:proline iminopeptidase
MTNSTDYQFWHAETTNFKAQRYTETAPFATHQLAVSTLHTLYVEEVGNPEGVPVVWLHGGPGSGCSEKHRQFFNPKLFRAILFDQRGAGRSTPHACLEENTTWHLVEDLETIRKHLGIEQWIVIGGSWGSTLALAYAQSHPQAVKALVLRGIFLCQPEELHWFYQEGCSFLSPHLWDNFVNFIPENERRNLIEAYYKRLTHPTDTALRLEACKRWAEWEGSNLKLSPDMALQASFVADDHAVSLARIECHYFMHNAFFTNETALLNPQRLVKMAHIPTTLIHGRYDIICPLKSAWDLKKALPAHNSQLIIVPAAGHASDEIGVFDAQQQALEAYATS